MEELQEIIDRVTAEAEHLSALTLEQVDAICADRDLTREEFVEHHAATDKLAREAAASLIRGAGALEAALVRLGLVSKPSLDCSTPPPWPRFARTSSLDGAETWESTEGDNGDVFRLQYERTLQVCVHRT